MLDTWWGYAASSCAIPAALCWGGIRMVSYSLCLRPLTRSSSPEQVSLRRRAGTDAVPRAHSAVSSLELSILSGARLFLWPADFGRGLQQPFGWWSSDGGKSSVCSGLLGEKRAFQGSVDVQEKGKSPGTFCLGEDCC